MIARPGKSFFLAYGAGFFTCILLLVVLAALSPILLKGFVASVAEKKLKPPPSNYGMQADYAWRVINMDGQGLDLESTRNKVLFLNFWHPDCPSCLAEIPSINRLYETLSGGDIEFICIAKAEKDEVEEAIQNEAIDFPVYLVDGALPEMFTSSSTPATYVITPTGEIAFTHFGGAKWDDPKFKAFLNALTVQE